MKVISKLLFIFMFFLMIPNVDAYSLGDAFTDILEDSQPKIRIDC
jgi:hypothetical protein